MRTLFAVAVLALGTAGVAQDKKDEKKDAKAPDKKEETYVSRDGKFAAKFPGTPTTSTKAPGGLTLHLFYTDIEKDKSQFLVTYCDLPPEQLKAPTPAQILASSEKGLVDGFKAKVTESGELAFGPKKLPARKIVAEKGEVIFRGIIVLVGNRLYQVFAIGPKDFVTGKDSDAFLASFEIKD
jgi:hypothetical protein